VEPRDAQAQQADSARISIAWSICRNASTGAAPSPSSSGVLVRRQVRHKIAAGHRSVLGIGSRSRYPRSRTAAAAPAWWPYSALPRSRPSWSTCRRPSRRRPRPARPPRRAPLAVAGSLPQPAARCTARRHAGHRQHGRPPARGHVEHHADIAFHSSGRVDAHSASSGRGRRQHEWARAIVDRRRVVGWSGAAPAGSGQLVAAGRELVAHLAGWHQVVLPDLVERARSGGAARLGQSIAGIDRRRGRTSWAGRGESIVGTRECCISHPIVNTECGWSARLRAFHVPPGQLEWHRARVRWRALYTRCASAGLRLVPLRVAGTARPRARGRGVGCHRVTSLMGFCF
jgi:hypothetical protein